jgi:cephalosporin hydroxylase
MEMKNFYYKILEKISTKILPWIDKCANFYWHNDPLTSLPIADKRKYIELSKNAEINSYSVNEIDKFENETGFYVDKTWLTQLGSQTQVVIKKSPLNYAHGRILYSSLRNYLHNQGQDLKKINIVETGTARGFSSICMAKALSESNFEGNICTIDVLPHNIKIFWNSITDHTHGRLTRNELLRDWSYLVERYIFYVQGKSKQILPKINFSRVHFAFLDGAHAFDDVMFEFNNISKLQIKGDIVVFDDYNTSDFPGVVKTVEYIENNLDYSIRKILNPSNSRGYVIASKL